MVKPQVEEIFFLETFGSLLWKIYHVDHLPKMIPEEKGLGLSEIQNTQGVLALITSLLHDPHDDKFSLHSALSRIEVADVLWWEMKGGMKGGNNGSFIHGRVVEEKMGKIRGMLSLN